MINVNIYKIELTVMCELKVFFNGDIVMEDVVRITSDGDSVRLYGMLGDLKTIHGRIVDVNLTKQEAIIEG